MKMAIHNYLTRVDVERDAAQGLGFLQNPNCKHGPSVLFKRYMSDGSYKQYYACSAFRDRKFCSFYMEKNEFEPADSENSKAKEQSLWKSHCRKYKRTWSHNFKAINSSFSSDSSSSSASGSSSSSAAPTRFQNLTGNVFKFCPSCSEFVVVGKLKQHADCGSIQQIHKEESHFPSKVLCPKSNPKCEAQFFFTDKSMEALLKILEDLHTEKLLCIGTPRIHEVIRTKRHSVKSSLLLDIDERFCNFFSTNEFVLYNMFNHYFFCGTRGRDSYLNYLKGCENLLLLMDPPFGGRMELVSNTIQAVEEDWRKMNCFGDPKTLPVILIFPYFNEKTVKSHIPSMSMLDYQVDYDNHPLYTTGPKGLKRGSAVRMFTNLSPRLFSFPEGEGYSFCASCDRWVHPRNVHCFECGDCTSKDGRTYKHCADCNVCVKPMWAHCVSCQRCLPKQHGCKSKEESTPHRKEPTGLQVSKKSQNLKHRKSSDLIKRKTKRLKKSLPQSRKEEQERDFKILENVLRMKKK